MKRAFGHVLARDLKISLRQGSDIVVVVMFFALVSMVFWIALSTKRFRGKSPRKYSKPCGRGKERQTR